MNYIKTQKIISLVRLALEEDIGRHDITSEAIIPKKKIVKAALIAKEPCVVCGVGIAGQVFKALDKRIRFKAQVRDGQKVRKGEVLAQVYGNARSILIAERVALNFLCLLSGIATKTRAYVEAVKPYKVKILDTRKTIPGLRELQKYAVRIGGGYNHRLRLDEMILVKDNHLQITDIYRNLPKFTQNYLLPITGIYRNLFRLTQNYRVELEVKNLKEFKQALKLNPDIIMLDNMSIENIKKAVKIRNNLTPNTYHLTPKLEASGGITLKNVKKIASCGVDMISIGALTHSVNSVDISLEILQ